jgi:opacity protein-like surface antigen
MEYGCCQRSAANLRKEKIMKKIILALVMCLAVGVAHAESYVKASIGEGNGNTVSTFGVGQSYNDWLSVEVDYRNLGGNTGDNSLGYTRLVNDPNTATYQPIDPATGVGQVDAAGNPTFARSCSLAATGCNDKAVYGKTSAKGLGVSALLKYDMDTQHDSKLTQTLFLRVGVLYSKSKYESYYTPVLPVSTNAATGVTYSSGFTPLFGVGIEIGRVALEITQYGRVYQWENGKNSTYTAGLSYRQPL